MKDWLKHRHFHCSRSKKSNNSLKSFSNLTVKNNVQDVLLTKTKCFTRNEFFDFTHIFSRFSFVFHSFLTHFSLINTSLYSIHRCENSIFPSEGQLSGTWNKKLELNSLANTNWRRTDGGKLPLREPAQFHRRAAVDRAPEHRSIELTSATINKTVALVLLIRNKPIAHSLVYPNRQGPWFAPRWPSINNDYWMYTWMVSKKIL